MTLLSTKKCHSDPQTICLRDNLPPSWPVFAFSNAVEIRDRSRGWNFPFHFTWFDYLQEIVPMLNACFLFSQTFLGWED